MDGLPHHLVVVDTCIRAVFDDESVTAAPVVQEVTVVALLAAHLRGDEAAINHLVDATNECVLFEATVGFLIAAFGESQVAAVLSEVASALPIRRSLPLGSLHAESRAANALLRITRTVSSASGSAEATDELARIHTDSARPRHQPSEGIGYGDGKPGIDFAQHRSRCRRRGCGRASWGRTCARKRAFDAGQFRSVHESVEPTCDGG